MAGKNLCDEYCRGCRYLGHLGGGWIDYCKYILMEGKSRGCPAGKNCTVKLTKRSGKPLTIDGETKGVTEWGTITGISKSVIYYWYKRHGRERTEQKVLEAWKRRIDCGQE